MKRIRNGRDNPPLDTYAYPYMTATLTVTQDVLRAFADPTRLRILNLLAEREVCVCDLCSVLDEIQPKVSRHLAYLRRAGLVGVRHDGKWKHYRIKRDARGLERTLINCVKSCLREIDVLQETLIAFGAAKVNAVNKCSVAEATLSEQQ